jgi:hypothetical protein
VESCEGVKVGVRVWMCGCVESCEGVEVWRDNEPKRQVKANMH